MKRSKPEETSLAELSEDVIHEIFLRLPHKSLGKCKLVSKFWNSIISNPEFTKAHLRFANLNGNSPSLLALHKCNTISLLKFDRVAYSVPLDQQFKPHRHDSYHYPVGSCDGIICIYTKTAGKLEDLMYLWNPTINKHKQIPLPIKNGLVDLQVNSCWFGYVTSVNTYKIFIVYDLYQMKGVEHKYIYSFKDHKWREMRETDEVGGIEGIHFPYFSFGERSVVMNESIHYLVGNNIHKFDLVAENIERIPLSIKSDVHPRSCHMLLGVVGETKRMCVMAADYNVEWIFDLWILEEYNKWDSWKRLYKTDLQKEIARDITLYFQFIESGYLLVCAFKGLMFIDLSHNPPLYFNVNGRSHPIHQVTNYVESLVSPLLLP